MIMHIKWLKYLEWNGLEGLQILRLGGDIQCAVQMTRRFVPSQGIWSRERSDDEWWIFGYCGFLTGRPLFVNGCVRFCWYIDSSRARGRLSNTYLVLVDLRGSGWFACGREVGCDSEMVLLLKAMCWQTRLPSRQFVCVCGSNRVETPILVITVGVSVFPYLGELFLTTSSTWWVRWGEVHVHNS